MGKHTLGDLHQMQSPPLSAKVQMTERRIREWVEYFGVDGADDFALEKSVYRTSGCSRTGCVFCGFGVHREKAPNRWEFTEALSNPAMIDFMLRGGDFDEKGIWKPDDRGLGFWFVIEWINTHGNLNIAMPRHEEYIGRYMTSESRKRLAA